MKTFDRFLTEADAKSISAKRTADAGGKLAGGVSGLAGAASSLAGGNFLGGVWGVLKSTLAAFEGFTDTAAALGKLSQIQKLHSRLYSHIASQHGEDVAGEYVKAVFEVDDDIILHVPPADWDSIFGMFIESLNGKIDDYQNLTFTHAIATVLEQNMARVKASLESQKSKWDRKLQLLDNRYHALEDFFQSSGESKPKTKPTAKPAPKADDYSGFSSYTQSHDDGSNDIFGGEPSADRPKTNRRGDYLDMDELKSDALAMLHAKDLPSDMDDNADQHQEIASFLEKHFKDVVKGVSKNWWYNKLTPENLIKTAESMIAKEKRERPAPAQEPDYYSSI
jgi:hypothetical protein